jgi:3-hydroxyacyl-CoA dehydrogenase
MGSLTGGLIAQNQLEVYFLSRTDESALKGVKRAIEQARSESIKKFIKVGNYDKNIEQALKDADWIIESVAENLTIKEGIYDLIEKHRSQNSIVSSMTSSLPLKLLCGNRSDNFKNHFLGVHFYNPPGKLLACEIAAHDGTSPAIVQFMEKFVTKNLHRKTILVHDSPAYAGNRIAFLIFAETTKMAEEIGVEMTDYLIGPYTGRALSPLATLDLVGLDIHEAIIKTVQKYTNDSMHSYFKIPRYLDHLIKSGNLGNKTPIKGGFYKKEREGKRLVYSIPKLQYVEYVRPSIDFVEQAIRKVRVGEYQKAFNIILNAYGREAEMLRKILFLYVDYSYRCIGEVADHESGIAPIDNVMGFGFNWAPPSLILEMLGGETTIRTLAKDILPQEIQRDYNFRKWEKTSGFGRYFIAR